MNEQQQELAATMPPQTVADRPAGTDGGDNSREGFSLPVRYNKQDYHLTRDEAVTYAQKGMKYTTMEPMLARLQQVARQQGLSADALVDRLCGEPKGDVAERLAGEFGRLRAECPEVEQFSQLPEAVVRLAVEQQIPLVYAYAYHRMEEDSRVKRAAAAQAAASAASAGGQRGEADRPADAVVQAMLRGIWS